MQTMASSAMKGGFRSLLVKLLSEWGQTWPSLVLSWAEQEPTTGPNLGATCPELAPVGSNLGSNVAQLGHVWAQVGLSMRNFVLCGALASRQAQSQKNVGNSGKHESFQRVAFSPQNCHGLGPTRARHPTCARVALSWG